VFSLSLSRRRGLTYSSARIVLTAEAEADRDRLDADSWYVRSG
jgi:hypothetical protein